MNRTRTGSLEYGDGFEPMCLIGRRSWSLLSSSVSGCAHTVSHKGDGLASGENHKTCIAPLGHGVEPKILWGAERQGQPGTSPDLP